MACIFTNKEGVTYISPQELIKEFYKNNYELKNASIFSKEEIQTSVINKILNIEDINKYRASELDNSVDSDGKPIVKLPVTTFISAEDKKLFSNIPGEKPRERLNPEYIEENRIIAYVKKQLEKPVPTLMDDYSGYSNKYLQILKSEFQNVDENILKHHLVEIESVIKIEDRTKSFGSFLHTLISEKLNDNPDYQKHLHTFINNPDNSDIFGENKSKWISKINEIVESVIEEVKKFGSPITEIFLVSDDKALAQVRGKIDLVAVDTSGIPHIFEIKISKHSYSDWDSAKLRNLDWQLALYKQLLGQHVNVDKAQLYVIPIELPVFEDPSRIFLGKIRNRKAENSLELGDIGNITRIANKLIPRKFIATYDPDREDTFKKDLIQLLPNYEIKANFNDTDFSKIMKAAEKVYERDGVWKWWNQFEGIEGLSVGYIVSDNKEEFEKQIQKYVDFSKTQTNRGVSTLRDALITSIKTNSPIKTTTFNSKKDIGPNHLLKEYLNNDWEVIADIPESVPLGVIVLKNKRNGMVNIISLSSNQFYANSDIDGKNYGDLEYYKALLFLNSFKNELLPTGFDKLGQIIVYNPEANQYYYRNTSKKLEEFIKLMHEKQLGQKVNLNLSNASGAEDLALYILDSQFRYYSGSEKETINEIANLFDGTSVANADLSVLIEAQKKFYSAFPSYKERTMNKELNFEDPKEVLFALLQTAIVTKEQQALTGDFQNMSNYSLGFSDFKSLVRALYTEDKEEYDKTGKRIQGLVGGLAFATPDFVRSNDLRNINSIISTGNAKIGELMSKESETIHIYSEKYYKKIGFNGASRNWWGETQSKHKNMWRLDNSDKVSDLWMTKNPYKVDLQNSMTDAERDYLKEMLFRINIYKLNLSTSEVANLDPHNLDSLKSNSRISQSIESEEYFKMPLVRREEYTKYSGGLWNFWKNKANLFLDFVDTRELTKEDVTIAQQKEIGFYEMYDAYGRQSDEYKANSLSKYGVNYFEWNLDTIAHRVAFNKIRKNIFDNRLPIINAYVWWIKLLGGKQNIDVSKQLEYISNQLKLGVYDEPIITDEFKDVATGIALAKRISTTAMLAFRPALMAKELTLGLMKGVALASTKIYGEDQFTLSDLTLAYKKLLTINDKFAPEFNLIDKLNHFYRFANMDINSMSQKVQTDRRGVVRGLGRWMYACNTIPDYYNRLSLFMAKMIHDGSYQAHSFVDGKLVYDPTKDERFSYYLKNRDNFKDSYGNFIPKKGDEKYNKQRQHYLLVMSQLNSESLEIGKKLKEGDLIDKAYSIKERNSFKSFTDMCYGYYDKDAQSQLNNTAFGMAWMQFMQFWPGKMKMWFGKPTDENSSPIGQFKQKSRQESGELKLLWRKPIYNEDDPDKIERFEETVENTGDPALEWTGTPQEGLFYSVMGTLQDIVKLDFKAAFTDEEHKLRRNRTMYAAADGILMLLLMGIIKAMWDGLIAENGTDGIDGTALQFMGEVSNKVLRETNVYQNTLGALSIEPLFLSYARRIAGDMNSVITGNSTMKNLLANNVGALEFIE